MYYKDSAITFSSGNACYANEGVIGISLKDDDLYYGYDGVLGPASDCEIDSQDMIELADYMLLRWEGIKEVAQKSLEAGE